MLKSINGGISLSWWVSIIRLSLMVHTNIQLHGDRRNIAVCLLLMDGRMAPELPIRPARHAALARHRCLCDDHSSSYCAPIKTSWMCEQELRDLCVRSCIERIVAAAAAHQAHEQATSEVSSKGNKYSPPLSSWLQYVSV